MAYQEQGYNNANVSVGKFHQETGHRVEILESLLVHTDHSGETPASAFSKAGDPVSFGEDGVGVVVGADAISETDFTIVQRLGVANLPVLGADGAGSAAIAVGDRVFIDGLILNADDTNGIAFGTALDAVGSGLTVNIAVDVNA